MGVLFGEPHEAEQSQVQSMLCTWAGANLSINTGWRGDVNENSPVEKDLGVLLDGRQDVS